MREELLTFLARREERITLGGAPLIVRELTEEDDVAALADGVDTLFKYIVRSVFDEAGAPVFTDADIPRLKQAGRVRLRELAAAVGRVNGWLMEDEVKNSAAGPSAG